MERLSRKQLREMLGYTKKGYAIDITKWYDNALSFHEAAKLLSECAKGNTQLHSAFLFNSALSLELLLKAILVKRKLPHMRTHDLCRLSRECGINITDDQEYTLSFLTETIIWYGRYPVPNDDNSFDHFHDTVMRNVSIFERRAPNYFTIGTNKKRYPSFENYMALWKKFHVLFEEAF